MHKVQERRAGRMSGQFGGAEGKPHQVVQVVIVAAAVFVDFQIVQNRLRVPHDRCEPDGIHELRVAGASLDQPQSEGQVCQADAQDHRAGPVHAARKGVLSNPVAELSQHLSGVRLVAGSAEGFAEHGQMEERRQIPRNLQIGLVVDRIEMPLIDLFAGRTVDLAPVPAWVDHIAAPTDPGLEIPLPVDRVAQRRWAAAEDVELVPQDSGGGIGDFLFPPR